jgi:hypothetical protein
VTDNNDARWKLEDVVTEFMADEYETFLYTELFMIIKKKLPEGKKVLILFCF